MPAADLSTVATEDIRIPDPERVEAQSMDLTEFINPADDVGMSASRHDTPILQTEGSGIEHEDGIVLHEVRPTAAASLDTGLGQRESIPEPSRDVRSYTNGMEIIYQPIGAVGAAITRFAGDGGRYYQHHDSTERTVVDFDPAQVRADGSLDFSPLIDRLTRPEKLRDDSVVRGEGLDIAKELTISLTFDGHTTQCPIHTVKQLHQLQIASKCVAGGPNREILEDIARGAPLGKRVVQGVISTLGASYAEDIAIELFGDDYAKNPGRAKDCKKIKGLVQEVLFKVITESKDPLQTMYKLCFSEKMRRGILGEVDIPTLLSPIGRGGGLSAYIYDNLTKSTVLGKLAIGTAGRIMLDENGLGKNARPHHLEQMAELITSIADIDKNPDLIADQSRGR